ncbi:hypothetical protein NPIL_227391 [Nephila pilipes]|uniref:Uncharacterized protein n=1 Tax=Nephila pilipes TaxID=299642 RepID=A0A8X6TP09_NEPPI|nr:hypothetical protein NPIL_227391 [Nephila pilipes]
MTWAARNTAKFGTPKAKLKDSRSYISKRMNKTLRSSTAGKGLPTNEPVTAEPLQYNQQCNKIGRTHALLLHDIKSCSSRRFPRMVGRRKTCSSAFNVGPVSLKASY